ITGVCAFGSRPGPASPTMYSGRDYTVAAGPAGVRPVPGTGVPGSGAPGSRAGPGAAAAHVRIPARQGPDGRGADVGLAYHGGFRGAAGRCLPIHNTPMRRRPPRMPGPVPAPVRPGIAALRRDAGAAQPPTPPPTLARPCRPHDHAQYPYPDPAAGWPGDVRAVLDRH